MKYIVKTEDIVKQALEENPRARESDFILYGAVLKRIGVDLKNTTLYDFLATANQKGYPTFETCSRARRKLQEIDQRLVDSKTAVHRERLIEVYKEYSRR